MNWLQDRNEILTLDFNQIWIDDEKENDLLPFLKEYGKTVEGVEPPEGSSFAGTRQLADTKELKVLDYNQPLDIPLSENAKLTGIGWIDDRLHVQIHLVGEAIQTSDGLEHMGATANAVCSVAENEDSLIWYDEDGDGFFDWLEYVFDAQPEDVEQSQLTSTVWEHKEILEDNWEIQVPINMLLPENGEDTESQEETTNQETAVPAG